MCGARSLVWKCQLSICAARLWGGDMHANNIPQAAHRATTHELRLADANALLCGGAGAPFVDVVHVCMRICANSTGTNALISRSLVRSPSLFLSLRLYSRSRCE